MNLASEDLQSYVQLCHSVEPRCQSPGTFTSHLFSINFSNFIASPDLAPLFNCIYTQYNVLHNAHLVDRQIVLVLQRV